MYSFTGVFVDVLPKSPPPPPLEALPNGLTPADLEPNGFAFGVEGALEANGFSVGLAGAEPKIPPPEGADEPDIPPVEPPLGLPNIDFFSGAFSTSHAAGLTSGFLPKIPPSPLGGALEPKRLGFGISALVSFFGVPKLKPPEAAFEDAILCVFVTSLFTWGQV